MIILLNRVKTVVNTHKPLRAALYTGSVIAVLFSVYTAGYVHLEKTSIVEGLWQSWQTFTTVGYGNAPASTDWGRYFSMVVGTIGIGFMAIFIAVSSDLRQYFRDQRRMGFMKNKFENGYVIINWPGRLAANKVINQLRLEEPSVPICFVDSELEELPPTVQSLNDVHYYRGNLAEKETYENANVRNNKAVIVFPKDPESVDADITTKSIVELVLKFINGDTDILYLLCDSENKWLFPKQAKPIMKNFWVMTLVQECQDKHSSSIIEKLVDNSDGESVNSLVINKMNGPFSWHTATLGLRVRGVNPIGLKKYNEEGVHLLPDKDTPIEKGDTIFLACENNKDLDGLHAEVFH